MARFKVTKKTSMSDVLKVAAKSARGKAWDRGFITATGGRCLYGEAFHMIGIADEDLRGAMPCFELLLLPGATEWFEGNSIQALDIACSTWGQITVGKARQFLQSQGASPMTLTRVNKET